MSNAGASIEAVLTLNSTGFDEGINSATTALNKFIKSSSKLKDVNVSNSIFQLSSALGELESSLQMVSGISNSSLTTFNKLSNSINKMGNGLRMLQSGSLDVGEAINTMNSIFKSFQGTLSSVEVKVQGVSNSIKNTSNNINSIKTSTQSATESLLGIGRGVPAFNRIDATSNKVKSSIAMMDNEFKKAKNDLLSIGQGVSSFNNIDSRSNKVKEQVRLMNAEFEKSKLFLEQLAWTGVESFNKISVGEEKASTAAKQLSASANEASASLNRTSASASQSASSMSKATTQTSRLKTALVSLKNVGMLVGSMLAYNFVHHLGQATNKTINAKSEMEGYFKMLHYGQSDIDTFNRALDNTVSRFQRVNKYNLGETISSIGVEFNLTTDEMIKAMDVTSMITSEYLRAGRNANEASLAVKDVLQGQFQRLSRETGVKGEDLKNAGWSGDNTDINGLLDALRKVGEDRNWDVFAEKANSLNDVVTILQNRFGEWAANMVNVVQPSIVGAFNMLMESGGKLATLFTGIWKWLNGDGLAETVTRWTLLGAGITSVIGALISYRTGASLVQIVQMGLTKSITATVLGLEAETVATYGTRTAIFSKITGLEAEKAAQLSVKQAIASKILGLEAEKVAEVGVKNATIESSLAQEAKLLKLKGVTAAEIENTLATYENNLSQKSSIGVISARVMGLNMATYAQEGFTVALLESATGMEVATLASMSLEAQIGLLVATVGGAIAIVGAFALAFGGLAIEMNNNAQAMSKFNKLTKEGEDIITNARSTVDKYTKKQESLKQKLSETKEGTAEYKRIQDELRATNEDLTTSNYNLENSISAVEKANSSLNKFEEDKTDRRIKLQHELAAAYREAGFSATESYEMANDSLSDAIAGAEQLREASQRLALADKRRLKNTNHLLEMYTDAGFDSDTIKERVNTANGYQDMISQGLEKGLTDESFFGRIDGWFTFYQGQIGTWWTNIVNTIETGNWGGAIQGAFWGVVHGLGNLPIFRDFWNSVWKATGIDKYKGQGWDGLKQMIWDGLSGLGSWIMGGLEASVKNSDWYKFITSVIDGVTKGWEDVCKWWDDNAVPFIHDLFSIDINGMVTDWFSNLSLTDMLFSALGIDRGINIIDFIGSLLGFDGTGDAIRQLINDNIILPVQELISIIMSDPIGTLGGIVLNPLEFLSSILGFSEGNSVGVWVNEHIITPLSNALYNGILQIPVVGDIVELLSTLTDDSVGADEKGKAIGDALGNGLTFAIGKIPVVGGLLKLLGVIPSVNPTAKSNGNNVGTNVNDGYFDGTSMMKKNALLEFSDIAKGIFGKAREGFSAAASYGAQVWKGLNSVFQRHSPGFMYHQVLAEFGTDIPSAISSSEDTAYSNAQSYGQTIVDGVSGMYNNMPQMNMDFFSNGALTDYQTDANTVTTISGDLSSNTTNAFATMQTGVEGSVNTMTGNVNAQYSNMQLKQNTMLNSMKNSNLLAYNQMQVQSNQSLLKMRDDTSKVTTQMISAWSHMKTQLVATANSLRSESTSHFNQLSSTIGSFYRKIQNPSNWGAGASTNVQGKSPRPSVGRRIASSFKHHGAGSPSTYKGQQVMSLRQLKRTICPNGECGSLFDGLDLNDKVNVQEFLSSITGEHGFGSWSGWNNIHYNHIKNKSDAWTMKSPQLLGRINTDADFKVGDFENGTPKISFGSFVKMAEALFSEIPYRFYYDSAWKGSWLGAIQAGACNCADGTDALLAFARTCGFDGSRVHGYWGDEGHFWAVINGKTMDTTAWQKGYGWTGPAQRGAGTPNGLKSRHNSSPSSEGKVVNVTIDMSGSVVYGVDDLDSKIELATKRAMREEFNDPFTVAL